jgi:hypothetical protein
MEEDKGRRKEGEQGEEREGEKLIKAVYLRNLVTTQSISSACFSYSYSFCLSPSFE